MTARPSTRPAVVPGSSAHVSRSPLEHAASRLSFPPAYIVVGAYRLVTDKHILIPVWDKCRHGAVRGLVVGLGWAAVSFKLQRAFIRTFWMNSPRVTGLSGETVLGYKVPFDLVTYATIVLVASQGSALLAFFLQRNLRIARARAWEQTVASRGKGEEFWQPYTEEWDNPPVVDEDKWAAFAVARKRITFVFVKQVALMFVRWTIPVAGLFVSAYFKAFDTASYLHRPYFESKKMTKREIATFIAEHQWDYRVFGFAAALVEGLPFIGLFFSISNRIGAAMWAFDLEKRQHYVAEEKRKRAS